MDYDIDSYLTNNLTIPDTTGTSISPADPSTDQFDLDKFQFILHDEKTYHYSDDSITETTNPVIEMPETDKENSQPSVETSQPDTFQPSVDPFPAFEEVLPPSCEVFVPEVNMSFTVPVLQTVPVTDRTNPNMDVMARNTRLNTTMKAKKTNNERCKAYRLRKKMETEQMMKDYEELQRKNEELKLIHQCRQDELNEYMKLLIRKKK